MVCVCCVSADGGSSQPKQSKLSTLHPLSTLTVSASSCRSAAIRSACAFTCVHTQMHRFDEISIETAQSQSHTNILHTHATQHTQKSLPYLPLQLLAVLRPRAVDPLRLLRERGGRQLVW